MKNLRLSMVLDNPLHTEKCKNNFFKEIQFFDKFLPSELSLGHL